MEKGTTEDEMVGWYHRLDGHAFEQALGVGDGQGGLVCCSGLWGTCVFFNYGFLAFDWEKAMAPHSSTLVWKIPWTEEPGRLQSMGSLRVGHD